MPALVAVGWLALQGAHWRGRDAARRRWTLALLALAMTALLISTSLLLLKLPVDAQESLELLRDATLLWVLNVLIFALWYWELDGGGPARRQATRCLSTDFVFPQMAIGGEVLKGWQPEFVDYLFQAFNTSTAFSPTDTTILGRRTKLLMMAQSIISLVTIAVLAARAINTL